MYLITVLALTLLLVGFLVLSWVETSRGFRILGTPRTKLDRQVARLSYIAIHIDWAGFFAHLAKTTAARVLHDVVHTTLLVVRATERTLTRAIRTLRARLAMHTPPGEESEGSQLIATIVRFRKNLRSEKNKKS